MLSIKHLSSQSVNKAEVEKSSFRVWDTKKTRIMSYLNLYDIWNTVGWK